ncbi:GT4 family glycosyltransferase PelF [Kineococcus esterisolvens]|uniref:GT4 family glycosyltransferase PelF n=1 Tax=Kineococcus sp. SYSU DK022 TaxID=3383143 RepID=UPI003D7EAB96
MSVVDVTGPASGSGPRVTLFTEGTYPFVVGGVSTWCDLLLRGLPDVRWSVFALTGAELEEPVFELPPNATLGGHLQLWGPRVPRRTGPRPQRRRRRRREQAAELVRGLLGWSPDPLDLVPALAWCRQNPDLVLPTFRDEETWRQYVEALVRVLAEDHPEVGGPAPFDLDRAVETYQTISWVARVAAEPTPAADVSLVTAAGWSAVPAAVDKALHDRPVVLSEHGVYVRENYLAAVRSGADAAGRFVPTRLARGLTRLAYAVSDVVTPVAEANAAWEEGLGVAPQRIVVIPNGVPAPGAPAPAPRTRTVVSVGRLDPLKDVPTMLRVAAAVRRRVPDATFLHYGPVPRGQEEYARSCHELHTALGLGEGFRFMGPTKDPTGVVREADVVLMTSISEGFPMSVLEALSQARPVVTTLVGGVLDAMRGAGVTAPPGDVHGLADAVCALLLDPGFAELLGTRGHARVTRLFGQDRCLDGYAAVLGALATDVRGTPAVADGTGTGAR